MEFGPGILYARIIKNFAEASLGGSRDASSSSSSSSRDASKERPHRSQEEWNRRLEEMFGLRGKVNEEKLELFRPGRNHRSVETQVHLVEKVIESWVRRLKTMDCINPHNLASVLHMSDDHKRHGDNLGSAKGSDAVHSSQKRRRFIKPSRLQQLMISMQQPGQPLEHLPSSNHSNSTIMKNQTPSIAQKVPSKRSLPEEPRHNREGSPQAPQDQTSPQFQVKSNNLAGDKYISDSSDDEWVDSSEIAESGKTLSFGSQSNPTKDQLEKQLQVSPSFLWNGHQEVKGLDKSTNLQEILKVDASMSSAPSKSEESKKFNFSQGALSAAQKDGIKLGDWLDDDSVSFDELYPNTVTLCNRRDPNSKYFHRIVGQIISSSRRNLPFSITGTVDLNRKNLDETASLQEVSRDEEEMRVLVLGNVIASIGSEDGSQALPREIFFRRLICRLCW